MLCEKQKSNGDNTSYEGCARDIDYPLVTTPKLRTYLNEENQTVPLFCMKIK